MIACEKQPLGSKDCQIRIWRRIEISEISERGREREREREKEDSSIYYEGAPSLESVQYFPCLHLLADGTDDCDMELQRTPRSPQYSPRDSKKILERSAGKRNCPTEFILSDCCPPAEGRSQALL